jgi:hypothetical protein
VQFLLHIVPPAVGFCLSDDSIGSREELKRKEAEPEIKSLYHEYGYFCSSISTLEST